MDQFIASTHDKLMRDAFHTYPFGKVYPSRSEERWTPYYEAIDKKYKNRKSLPTGTILYHGSLYPKFAAKDPVTYFGLDFAISAWILAESWAKRFRNDETLQLPPYSKWHGYVHVFRLKKPLKYYYVEESDCTPMDYPHNKICSGTPCVHAQVIFHEGFMGDNNFVDLGTEVTIPHEEKYFDLLEHVGTHKLDITKLMLYRAELPSKWDPKNAVIGTA